MREGKNPHQGIEVILAGKSGMCFGVKRALDLARQAGAPGETGEPQDNKPRAWVLGQLVHNRQVSDWLARQGIEEISSTELKDHEAGGIYIVPSHGKGPLIYDIIEKKGGALVDATCPFVSQALKKAKSLQAGDYFLLIYGDPGHEEVIGYQEWLGEGCRVVKDFETEMQDFPLPSRLAVMAQTTANQAEFSRFIDWLHEKGYQPLVLDTICSATKERREAAENLAARVDAMVVIGGKNSANTKNLAAYCQKLTPTFLIETKEDIDPSWFAGIKSIGITAGASTPEWIIKEVVEMMEEFKDQEQVQEQTVAAQENETDHEVEANFSDMEAEMGCLEFHPGDVVKGTVVKVSPDEVLVDIGYKSEGIIPAFELAFTKVDPQTVVKVGDEISVEVVKEDREGNVILSRKNALFEERINALEEAFEKGEPVTATVIDVVKGGLLVDVGMRGFVPASHVERGFVKDLSEYLKQTLDFKILELNRQGRKVILSRKALLEEEYQKVKESFWSTIEEGQTRKGIVKRLTDFGAFVDIGGCDGLLHVSEMGWGKVAKPADVVAINDEIEVYILKVDREKEKISLSLKKLIPNPWDLASEKYQVGGTYTGKVMRGASFGAFIQLEPNLEGLAHISQLARFRVNKVEDVLTEGMEIPVKILDINLEKKRISLSVKEAIDLPKLTKDEVQEEEKAAPAAASVAAEAAPEQAETKEDETQADAVNEAIEE